MTATIMAIATATTTITVTICKSTRMSIAKDQSTLAAALRALIFQD
jgi:hypothetical protein